MHEPSARELLLAGLPVTECRRDVAGVSTAVLEGGEGPPMVLLHGPGEFAAGWLPVLPRLTHSHRVIAPDLPGHGASPTAGGPLAAAEVLRWLAELVEQTCPEPPVLVGRVAGGAIAARFAAAHGDRIAALVLVDTLGLAPFRPDPRFWIALQRFFAEPTDHSYHRVMEFCAFDLDRVREQLGPRWEAYAAYAVELVGDAGVQAALGSLIGQFGAVPIPPEEMAGITVPTALIWGRHDLATPLHVAEEASARYGWPLHVIEDAGDDPPLDRPDAFLDALRAATASVAVG
ncbi:alpha/beta hydrolase [Pseudonocardia sp. DSM 110487]|uniref:alpha/beta fold hydrolase n=1 Tax=Pseudonocardia sp. DSM 110487 TaxID=2865833 RepID=UPI001C6A61DA|nr:alpha/beta hydrolase [Pseudonocardia sp. DSM 110487]QYN31814.1 alpha/beta hydrolase [Pseudonocardia sp. DSM 110487]